MENKSHSRQVGGDHYQKKTVQPWDVMKEWMSREAFIGFLEGNVIKYLARYKDKNGVADLKKAAHYLEKLIEVNEDVSSIGIHSNKPPYKDSFDPKRDLKYDGLRSMEGLREGLTGVSPVLRGGPCSSYHKDEYNHDTRPSDT